MAVHSYNEVSWERMTNAVEKIRQRLLRAARALEQAQVPYAVAGGNAVAAWVSRVDETAVRNTRDVDIVLRRSDLSTARTAMEQAGFVYRHVAGVDMLDRKSTRLNSSHVAISYAVFCLKQKK